MRILAVIAFAVAGFLLAADGGPQALTLLETGLFHGGEAPVKSGDGWLGLVHDAGNSSSVRTLIRVEQAEDPIVDAPGETTGSEVMVDGPAPVFLTRGIPSLTAGHVHTVLLGSDGGSTVTGGESLRFTLAGEDYRLIVTNRGQLFDRQAKPSSLIFHGGGISQKLYEWPKGLSDEHCELIWAGDLDGDRKLDLYMDISNHYNVTHRRLYLSSAAEDGELVKEVASFRTVGC